MPSAPLSTSSNSEPELGAALFSRFTLPARKACSYAERQCAAETAAVVDSSHVFAGLMVIDKSESNGLRLLSELGVDVEGLAGSLRNSGFISSTISAPQSPFSGAAVRHITLGDEGKAFLRKAAALADSFGQGQIGTEHLVLAYLSLPETFGYRVLSGFGVTLDAARELFGKWLVSGEYLPETSTAPPTNAQLTVRSLGVVYQIYHSTRIGYLALIFVPCILSFFLSTRTAPSLFNYLNVMGPPLYLYVFPYIVSTFPLVFLLRSRVHKKLLDMPPGKSMDRLTQPFVLCLITGALLTAALVPMFHALLYSRTFVSRANGVDVLALFLSLLVTINAVATVTTHWLLTFNIRGNSST